MKRIDLFVVDGLNDFCDPKGALFVAGADKEALKVASLIDRGADPKVQGGHKISNLKVMIDSHHRKDCSHNISWKDANGNSPPPFTVVMNADVAAHKYTPRFSFGVWEGKQIPSHQWALKYTAELEANGRSPLCLWPVHCVIGTWGQNIYPPLMEAYNRWTDATNRWIDPITKGQWPWTEHYSGFKADVTDDTRPETQLNTAVINDSAKADVILWTGWAGSHCLRWTALDAINFFGSGSNDFIKKSVFFEDASAAVPNPPGGPDFAKWRQEFLDEVKQRGATVTTTDKYFS